MAPAKCSLCDVPLEAWFETHDRHLVRCSECGLIRVTEGLAMTDEGVSIYEADSNVFLADGNEGYYLDETNFMNSRRKLDWVCSDTPSGATLLDAGSNFGHFLKVAGERFAAQGFDVSPGAVAWGERHLGVHASVASIYDLPASLNGHFDAVTCWDVIEHLPDPLAALEVIGRLLRPLGLLFISTPDAGSVTARVLGRHWHYLDPVQHITVFSRRNLTAMLARAGFDVMRIGSIGHHYRLRYVFDRLAYLHPHGALRRLTAAGRRLMAPAIERCVYLNPGDVMILTAARRDRG
jgi:SAM-dependent methyltransferase